MKPEIHRAKTDDEREAVYRLRYEIYVEEMNRYGSIADHDRRFLIEPDDAVSRLYYARDQEGHTVGTMRLTWGGDGEFSDRHVEQYGLAPFLEKIPRQQMLVGERFMVTPEQRGTDLVFRMFESYLDLVREKRIQLMFGDCEPHLLNLYMGMGFRTYSSTNVNSPETGYLILLVLVPEDLEYMRAIGSPLVSILPNFGTDSRLPACLADLLADQGTVASHTLTNKQRYWSDIDHALELSQNPIHLFDGLDDTEQERCLSKSNTIECRQGDHLIKEGNVAQNLFVVLAGLLEIRVDGQLVAVCTSGDVVGEMAFLLESPRSADVYAAQDDTRVLSLSESALRELMAEDPVAASKLLLNLSKLLCYKLLRSK